jgi:hypothetical protein
MATLFSTTKTEKRFGPVALLVTPATASKSRMMEILSCAWHFLNYQTIFSNEVIPAL